MNEERLLQVLLSPHISEKSTMVGEESNQVIFKVLPSAKKAEIKKAVEKLFNVEVMQVRVSNVKGKRKGAQRNPGKRPDWKKAYVRLGPGHDIDFTVTE